MANIKSSKKRVLVAERNRQRNVAAKSEIKTMVKKTLAAAEAKNMEDVKTYMSAVYKLCDKATGKGILHKNTAARKKSRLTVAVNKLLAE